MITKLTQRKIRKVKALLKGYVPGPTKHSQRYTLSLHDIARQTGVSYYSVWCIKEGKYDTGKPLQEKEESKRGIFNVDELWNWIVGGAKDLDSKSMAA